MPARTIGPEPQRGRRRKAPGTRYAARLEAHYREARRKLDEAQKAKQAPPATQEKESGT